MRARIAASSTMRMSRCCRSLFDGDDSATAASVSSTPTGSGSGLKRRTTPRPARRRMASLPASVSGTAPMSPKRRSSSSCRVFMKASAFKMGPPLTNSPEGWARSWVHALVGGRIRRTRFMERGAEIGGSVRLDTRKLDHLAPLLDFIGDELAEVHGRTRQHRAAQFDNSRLDLGIN
jgi:hypothetical protein